MLGEVLCKPAWSGGGAARIRRRAEEVRGSGNRIERWNVARKEPQPVRKQWSTNFKTGLDDVPAVLLRHEELGRAIPAGSGVQRGRRIEAQAACQSRVT